MEIKQDNLFYEWNPEKDGLDIVWVKEEDGKYHQFVKTINKNSLKKILPNDF